MKKDIRTPAAAASKHVRKRKNDIIFISVLLLLISLAAAALYLFRTPGDTVTVTVSGQLFGEYPLGEDRTVRIGDGGRYNLLVIEAGRAYVSQASCPDGICVAHRPIGHGGESIICLPNQVVIEIHTQNREHPDIIT